jgi:hypothetical protein
MDMRDIIRRPEGECMLSSKYLMAGLVAGMTLAGGVAALAQPAPKPEAGPHPDRQARMQQFCAEMPARTAGRLSYTEVKIGITEQQRAAWQTFAQDVKAAMQPAQKACLDRAAAPRPTTRPDAVAQLTEREKALGIALETTKGLRMAVEKVSPSLNDDQKKQLAELVGRMGRSDWGHHRMKGHHKMPRHDRPQSPPGNINAPAPQPSR